MRIKDPYKTGDAYSPSLLTTDACSPERAHLAFSNIKLALDMLKHRLKHEEDGEKIIGEIDAAVEYHSKDYVVLKDFSECFSRMHDHIETAKDAIKFKLAHLSKNPDTDPGGLGRDTERETRMIETLNFLIMLENVHQGRDPLTGAQDIDIGGANG